MKPDDIQVIGEELAIKWEGGGEDFIPLARLRQACPCASCHGETDILGNIYKEPDSKLTPESIRLARVQSVGGYAIQPVWGDGHSTGIYSFDYLKRIAQAPYNS